MKLILNPWDSAESPYEVWLNGQRIKDALEADNVKGYVISPSRHKDSYFSQEYMMHVCKRTGKVEFIDRNTGVVL